MIDLPKLQKTQIIGFGHKARHGKDWAAETLVVNFPKLVKRYAFSTALKAYCRVARGMTKKDGSLLQQVGTDELRAQDPDIWLKALYWQLDEEEPPVAVIADVRFPNEADWIRSQGGYVVRVQRWNRDGSLYVAADRDPLHESETALDSYPSWDYLMDAYSGDVEFLSGQAVNLFQTLQGVRHARGVELAV